MPLKGDIGLIEPSGPCTKGYYCGEKTSTPIDQCATGHYCVEDWFHSYIIPIKTLCKAIKYKHPIALSKMTLNVYLYLQNLFFFVGNPDNLYTKFLLVKWVLSKNKFMCFMFNLRKYSSVQTGCPIGTYQDSPQQDSCKSCDAGSLCGSESLSSSAASCPKGKL